MGTYIEGRLNYDYRADGGESGPLVNVKVTQPGNPNNPETFSDAEGNFKLKSENFNLPLKFEREDWKNPYFFNVPGSVALGAGWLITINEKKMKYNPMWLIGGGLLASFLIYQLTKKKSKKR
jgi:hypothetical protein